MEVTESSAGNPRGRRVRGILGVVVVGVVAFVTGCAGGSGTGAEEVPIDSNPVAALIKRRCRRVSPTDRSASRRSTR